MQICYIDETELMGLLRSGVEGGPPKAFFSSKLIIPGKLEISIERTLNQGLFEGCFDQHLIISSYITSGH